MIFNGLNHIDLDDWKYNTIYQGDYYKGHKVVNWFWEIMDGYNQEQL